MIFRYEPVEFKAAKGAIIETSWTDYDVIAAGRIIGQVRGTFILNKIERAICNTFLVPYTSEGRWIWMMPGQRRSLVPYATQDGAARALAQVRPRFRERP